MKFSDKHCKCIIMIMYVSSYIHRGSPTIVLVVGQAPRILPQCTYMLCNTRFHIKTRQRGLKAIYRMSPTECTTLGTASPTVSGAPSQRIVLTPSVRSETSPCPPRPPQGRPSAPTPVGISLTVPGAPAPATGAGAPGAPTPGAPAPGAPTPGAPTPGAFTSSG